jgi:hypothetical protein
MSKKLMRIRYSVLKYNRCQTSHQTDCQAKNYNKLIMRDIFLSPIVNLFKEYQSCKH